MKNTRPACGPEAEKAGLAWESVLAWAETKRTHSLVARPRSVEECAGVIEFARKQGLTICPRGAGYSFGDMILNEGQIILDMCRMNRILSWDEKNGRLIAEPGVVFGQILRQSLGSCWTLASCVGGMGVTVAGAISNNVHGKDSWKIGNFGDHVLELKLLTATGEMIRLDRTTNLELFQAVVGGMGQLGIIIEASLQLHRIPSPFVEAITTPARDLFELIGHLERAREGWDFAVAWVDAFATGKELGRGAVQLARWLENGRQVDTKKLQDSLTESQRIFGVLPAAPTWTILRPFSGSHLIQFLNAVKYRGHKWQGPRRRVMLFTDFNFIHRKIPNMKHIYRPHGIMEFQPLIPRKAGVKALAEIFHMCQVNNTQSLLCGLKMHGPDDYMLSYEGDGYSLGIDIALRGRNGLSVQRFARDLYGYVADQGGKIFLAKDELLPRDLFERMYPQHSHFRQVKRRVDPQNLFASDMYRRLLASS